METSIPLQLAALYSKHWFKIDSEYTVLRELLSKYVYAYELSKEDLAFVLLNKYSDYVTDKIKKDNYERIDTLSNFVIDVEENKRRYGFKNQQDAIICTIMSHISFDNIKLPRFDFRLIGIKNYGGFEQGMTYKELSKRLNRYDWDGEFYIENNMLKIK